jgi:energy-converting hydrogenase B subunit D
MNWELELVLFIFLLTAAIIALRVKDLLTAVVTLGVFSFLSALLYVSMGAIDVGFTEAVVGAGITTVLFIVAIHQTQRRSID